MKKVIFFFIAAMSAATLCAQTVNVHFKNGQKVQFNSANVDYVDFSVKAPDPTLTPGAVVDLGLSVYWASCNLGAEKPEEYGDYYAWGETQPKSSYTQANYSYYDNDKKVYIEIGDDISGTEYDAATVNWGTDWKMPTKAQLEELKNQCTWEWTQISGHNGYKITGPSGNSIFLPAAGYQGISRGSSLYYRSSSYIVMWGTSTSISIPSGHTYADRYSGYSIRPVTTNPNASDNAVDHTNDYLVTDKISASYLGGSYTSTNNTINNGSKLNWKFTNGSTESVTLTGVQLINGVTGNEGNNLLSEEVEVAAGEAKSYTITVGVGGIQEPKIRFTYRYNRKKYTVEASMSQF